MRDNTLGGGAGWLIQPAKSILVLLDLDVLRTPSNRVLSIFLATRSFSNPAPVFVPTPAGCVSQSREGVNW